jgi:ribosome-associated toxin RatA of RatAB toxin-antitoxin module
MKKLLTGILVFIAIILLIGIMLPSHTWLSETIVINAPADMIFEEVNNLKQWGNWSPWHKKDPTTIMTYEGPDSGVGCKMMWDSKSHKVGKGSQEIIKSILNKHIEAVLSFAGCDHTTQSSWDFEERDGNCTQVTWNTQAT